MIVGSWNRIAAAVRPSVVSWTSPLRRRFDRYVENVPEVGSRPAAAASTTGLYRLDGLGLPRSRGVPTVAWMLGAARRRQAPAGWSPVFLRRLVRGWFTHQGEWLGHLLDGPGNRGSGRPSAGSGIPIRVDLIGSSTGMNGFIRIWQFPPRRSARLSLRPGHTMKESGHDHDRPVFSVHCV